jgi:hypothetical protein
MTFDNLLADSGPRIGVFVSGGLDSAFLLYLLMRENQTLGKKIVVFTVPKADGSVHYASKVVSHIANMLNVEPPQMLLAGDPNLSHDIIVFSAWWSVSMRNLVDTIFLADNITPDLELSGLAPVRSRVTHLMVRQPLFDYTKDILVNSIFQYGVESLIDVTHTCTERARGRCKMCWQCNERAWAFTHANRVDTGDE